MNEGVFPVSQKIHNVNLNLKLEYRICSFSDTNALSSQLMWGHYAAAGMGVAIEIDASPVSLFEEVKYGEKDRHNSVVEILTNKSSQWNYEYEWRYLTTNPDKYFPAKITKVYFGTPYQHLSNYEDIIVRHNRLKKYLQRSATLREECDKSNIPCDNYQLS